MPRYLFGLVLLARCGFPQQLLVSTIAGGVPPPTPVPAVNTSIGNPFRLATDTSGNLYFGSPGTSSGPSFLMKVDSDGFLTRLAGDARAGYSGDGGPANKARVGNPTGIVVESDGTIYFADTFCHCVRKIDTTNTITTVAGNGNAGSTGDGGAAIAATLSQPMGLAIDSAHNLFIADTQAHVVRMVNTDGVISTVAGTGVAGASGDGGPANRSQLRSPWDVAVDSAGNLYIADTGNSRIRQVSEGAITTLAGAGQQGFAGDGAAARLALLNNPTAIAVDSAGLVFVADSGNKRIRAIDPQTGNIGTLAGADFGPPPLIGQNAQLAPLSGLTGLALDHSGSLYFAQGRANTGVIWKITPDNVLALAGGNGLLGYSGDGGPAAYAQLSGPSCAATDSQGNLYIADTLNYRVRRISPDGYITTVAGNGQPQSSGDGGPATEASLSPTCVASDPFGNLFIADNPNSVVRRVGVDGLIGTVAGNGQGGNAPDGVPALVAGMSPSAVTLDSAGSLYIADNVFSVILKVTSDGFIHNIAGGALSPIKLAYPHGMAVDTEGNVYVADTGDARIVKISSGGDLTVLAGQGKRTNSDGGPATEARLQAPWGLVRDSAGRIYFSDGPLIRCIDIDGTLTTIAGGGSAAFADGAAAADAGFLMPLGLALGPDGSLYVVDAQANAVRLISTRTLHSVNVAKPVVLAVTNAASNLSGPVAPGELIAIYGNSLGPQTVFRNQPDFYGFFGSDAGGASVLFDGRPGAMVYSSAGQVSAAVPYGIAGPTVKIAVLYQGLMSDAVLLPVADANPAILTTGSGKGQAAALNQDASANGSDNPAAIGSVIALFATGEGQTNPKGVDGKRTGSDPPQPVLPLTVTIDGQPAPVLYAAEAPGQMAGLLQINVVVPSGIKPGDAVPVILGVGSNSSPPGVTIAVR